METDFSSVETEGPQQGRHCLCGSELPITGGWKPGPAHSLSSGTVASALPSSRSGPGNMLWPTCPQGGQASPGAASAGSGERRSEGSLPRQSGQHCSSRSGGPGNTEPSKAAHCSWEGPGATSPTVQGPATAQACDAKCQPLHNWDLGLVPPRRSPPWAPPASGSPWPAPSLHSTGSHFARRRPPAPGSPWSGSKGTEAIICSLPLASSSGGRGSLTCQVQEVIPKAHGSLSSSCKWRIPGVT